MGRILSQEEVDVLRASARDIDRATRAAEGGPGEPVPYDFRRPDRVSKEQIRSLHFLHDRFTRKLSSSLAAYLRAGVEIVTVSIDQFTYGEFLMGLPDPTAFYALSLPPIEGLGALELNPALAFALIDRMLGGRGRGAAITRSLTEIEQHVVDAVIKVILENLTETWRPILDVNFEIHARETHPQMLQVAPPNEPVLVLVFEVRAAEAKGMLNLCVPTGAAGVFAQGFAGTRREPTAVESRRLSRNLARVRVPLTASIEARMTAREILDLRPGDVVSLGRPVSEPFEVSAGRILKYLARPIRSGHGAALAVESLVSSHSVEVPR